MSDKLIDTNNIIIIKFCFTALRIALKSTIKLVFYVPYFIFQILKLYKNTTTRNFKQQIYTKMDYDTIKSPHHQYLTDEQI